MTGTQLGTCLIRVFEGFRGTAYQDSGGVWTIGFGHTQNVHPGDEVSFEQAQALAEADFQPLLKLLAGVKNPLAQGAYLSFGYNAGYGSLSHVLAGTAKLGDFIHDRHGNVLPGLVARRALEEALVGWPSA